MYSFQAGTWQFFSFLRLFTMLQTYFSRYTLALCQREINCQLSKNLRIVYKKIMQRLIRRKYAVLNNIIFSFISYLTLECRFLQQQLLAINLQSVSKNLAFPCIVYSLIKLQSEDFEKLVLLLQTFQSHSNQVDLLILNFTY